MHARRIFPFAFAASILAAGYLMAQHASGDSHKAGDDHGHAAAPAQDMGPTKDFHLYLCAFHLAKNDPNFALEAHHYCQPVGDTLHQCVIYDSNKPGAKLIGVEYIISDEQYKKMAEDEKQYWHPHVYEIMSGQLMAPGLPQEDEDGLMKSVLLSWGKTWHTWPDPKTELPTGEPILMWSSGADGQTPDNLVEQRDRSMNVDTEARRTHRAEWGNPVPDVAFPKSKEEKGRQWTSAGEDAPAGLVKKAQ